MARNIPKKDSQKRHFKKRVKERFDCELNRFDIRNIIQQIREEPYTFRGSISIRLSCHLVRLPDNQLAYVLYDRIRKVPVTALTEAMWNNTVEKGEVDE